MLEKATAIRHIPGMIEDPANLKILSTLAMGKALTAGELSTETGLSKKAAYSHLSSLLATRCIALEQQGPHKYYRVADPRVTDVLTALVGSAKIKRFRKLAPGPKDPRMRRARACYDHLAGDLGVKLFDSLKQMGCLESLDGEVFLTAYGRDFLVDFGIDMERLAQRRRVMCRPCLDWGIRRPHLAGAVGAALLERLIELGWAERPDCSRRIDFSPTGERAFLEHFGILEQA